MFHNTTICFHSCANRFASATLPFSFRFWFPFELSHVRLGGHHVRHAPEPINRQFRTRRDFLACSGGTDHIHINHHIDHRRARLRQRATDADMDLFPYISSSPYTGRRMTALELTYLSRQWQPSEDPPLFAFWMASSEVDQKFLGHFAKDTSVENNYLSR